jgi:hypothetical protein
MTEDRGPWMVTCTGRKFFLADPREEEFNEFDIAVHTSRICRYGGGISSELPIYVVAQHSVLVDRILDFACMPRARKWGLMHDAPEAFYGDKISPLKRMFPDFCALEDRAAAVMRRRFNIPYDDEIKEEVHWADQMAWQVEAPILVRNYQDLWSGERTTPFDIYDVWPDFRILTPEEARREFLLHFYHLFG